ncbi:MAG: 50S ribosomal protein L13 [bacterium]|nr:50S ribosomal protein L13 [bacterium]
MLNTNLTYQPKAKDIKREWHLIDAKDKILGRLATGVARLLIGKHKKTYVPHLDSGDYVVVTNAESILVTGNKEKQKTYYRHSGYPGGLKSTTLGEMRKAHPTRIIELAVKNMLPKNRLQDKRMGRLKIFAGESHPYGNKLT